MLGRGKREIPEKTRQPTASSGTIPTCGNPIATPLGIESGTSSELEVGLVSYIVKMQELRFDLTVNQTRHLAYKSTKQSGSQHPFNMTKRIADGIFPIDRCAITDQAIALSLVTERPQAHEQTTNDGKSTYKPIYQLPQTNQGRVTPKRYPKAKMISPISQAGPSSALDATSYNPTPDAIRQIEWGGRNGRSPRKPADQRHRPATIPPCENSGMTRPEIEPGLPWWHWSRLTAQPPRPLASK
ncbi:hypothetical protein PR048_031459 [Dryococelus australis]|uniref:Uncharacterized protein n=1 Tax=Dryococelus australis TaxID=614101 RepID=A0ABQ9G812_9NEOP|nr:hypothetical protein PR048_031459 [Dryococelus australis]